MRSMRQELKECCTSVVLDNPFKKKFPQNQLDEDIFLKKKRAASSLYILTLQGGRTCVSEWVPGSAWVDTLRDGYRRKEKLLDYLVKNGILHLLVLMFPL